MGYYAILTGEIIGEYEYSKLEPLERKSCYIVDGIWKAFLSNPDIGFLAEQRITVENIEIPPWELYYVKTIDDGWVQFIEYGDAFITAVLEEWYKKTKPQYTAKQYIKYKEERDRDKATTFPDLTVYIEFLYSERKEKREQRKERIKKEKIYGQETNSKTKQIYSKRICIGFYYKPLIAPG